MGEVKEKEKFRNVTFSVSVDLIEEIDAFCKEKGGLKRKEWFFDLMRKKEIYEFSSKTLVGKLKEMTDNVRKVQSDYDKLFVKSEMLNQKLNDVQTAHSELFTSTLKYRTFFKRLKNLFTKF